MTAPVLTPAPFTPDPSRDYDWAGYARWAIGPLMTRQQWEADRDLLHDDWPAWRKRHNV